MNFNSISGLVAPAIRSIGTWSRNNSPKIALVAGALFTGYALWSDLRKTERELLALDVEHLSDGHGVGRGAISSQLEEVPQEQRGEFIEQALGLFTPDMDGYDRAFLISALAGVRQEQRGDVIEQAMGLFTPDTTEYERAKIISALAGVRQEQRGEFIEQALGLFTPDTAEYERAVIISALAGVRQEQRGEFIEQALGLFTPNMLGCERSWIITALSRLPQEQRGDVLGLAMRLLILGDGPRFVILENIINIGVNERTQRVTRALNQMQVEILILDGWELRDRLIQLLETPLNQPVPLLRARMAVLAAQGAQGINVHDGQRDAFTRKMIERLRVVQEPVSEERTAQAVEEFRDFLRNAPVSDEKKGRASRALEGSQGQDTFGPLLGNDVFSIRGLVVTGKECIARLWKFSGSYQDPSADGDPEKVRADQENARMGMINALDDSFNEDGRRVCNPGKTQRLVLAVLQDRLLDAQGNPMRIDDIPLTTNQRVASFLQNEVIQAIDNRAALLVAANQYLDQNPDADRDPFLAAIGDFANLQELPMDPQ